VQEVSRFHLGSCGQRANRSPGTHLPISMPLKELQIDQRDTTSPGVQPKGEVHPG